VPDADGQPFADAALEAGEHPRVDVPQLRARDGHRLQFRAARVHDGPGQPGPVHVHGQAADRLRGGAHDLPEVRSPVGGQRPERGQFGQRARVEPVQVTEPLHPQMLQTGQAREARFRYRLKHGDPGPPVNNGRTLNTSGTAADGVSA